MKINDLSFLIKLAISPIVVFLFMLVIFWQSISTSTQQQEALYRVVEVESKRASFIKEISSDFQSINGQVFQTLTFAAAEKYDDPTSELLKVSDSIDSLVTKLERLAKEYSEAELSAESKIVRKEIEEIKTYQEAISVVADFIEIDFSAAAEQVSPFVENADKILSVFNNLANKQSSLAEQEYRNAEEVAAASETFLTLMGIIAVVISAPFTYLLGTRIARSIKDIADSTRKLSEGNTDIDVSKLERNDELGEIVTALQVFRDKLIETETMREEQKRLEEAQRQSEEENRQADITRQKEQLEADKVREEENRREHEILMTKVADDFDQTVSKLLVTLKEQSGNVLSTSTELQSRSSQTLSLTNNAKDSSSRISSNMHSVAAATEEMSSSVQEITRQVSEASRVSQQAVSEVTQSTQSVIELNERAQKIGDVIKIITDIAEQTNLLALNATIEAARAGDAGKGFAVVASEVKNLANQTANATDEISEQIKSIQQSTEFTVNSIERISTTIQKVEEVSSVIAATVEEQGAATQEINQTVVQTNSDADGLSSDSQQLSSNAEENGKVSSILSEASNDLLTVVDKLESAADNFVQAIRP
ncbi:methyl-accepting chemotaxis protein [Temperatibacter marinus]|uniref:Methyl-accepting chemotaxis protein n=1 Tax=Temperatibacter marinus TaxID=1456591 RepID=A0AA52EI77_9PROT|nr:methyl-accepting chemotaxis protein [Temperatibacter marinus]WND02516.1 methyl-accepting chemotaxis protein [Temperatibacter marinus]